jgi:hypothetical protein
MATVTVQVDDVAAEQIRRYASLRRRMMITSITPRIANWSFRTEGMSFRLCGDVAPDMTEEERAWLAAHRAVEAAREAIRELEALVNPTDLPRVRRSRVGIATAAKELGAA